MIKRIIPENVKAIGCSAFAGCEKLKRIIITKSVTKIGDYNFSKKTTIICKKNSYAHKYAKAKKYLKYKFY